MSILDMSKKMQIRGMMEQSIDVACVEAKDAAKLFQIPEMKKRIMLKDENDFAVGVAWGAALKTFQASMAVTHMRLPTDAELGEFDTILMRRMPEIRAAVFNAG